MVSEVNKIIYNLLLLDGEVYIGGVGSLYTERYGAYRASRKSMTPPHRVVLFTTEQRGVSLEDEIARVAEVDGDKAHELFDRWLSEVLDGDTLTIEGVGVLRRDKFVVEESFATLLNPQGRTPVRLKPKANVALYIFSALCVLFALVVAGYVYFDSHDITHFSVDEEVATITQEVVAPTEQTIVSEVSTDTVAVTDTMSVQGHLPSQSQPQSSQREVSMDEVLYTTPGESYVVLGVFSTTENAAKAIRQAQKNADGLHYATYHYGEKYMVTLYSAPSRSECQEFVRSQGNAFKDLWIYSRK